MLNKFLKGKDTLLNFLDKMKKWRGNHKKLSIALIITFALIIAVSLLNSCSKKKSDELQAPRIVEKGTIVQSVSSSATVQTSFSRDVISSNTLEVVEINVEEGQHVNKGDILGQLKTDDLKEAVQQAKLQLDSASISKQQAEVNVRSAELENQVAQQNLAAMPETIDLEPSVRNAWLTMDGLPAGHQKELAKVQYAAAVQAATTSRNQIIAAAKRAENNLESAKLALGLSGNGDNPQVAIARATLASAQRKLNDATIKAPQDGTVTHIFAKVGSAATGSLFRIEGTEHLKLTAPIDEYDVGKLQLGQKVKISSDVLEGELEGEVSKIPVAADASATGAVTSSSAVYTIEITITIENVGKLLPGMSATASIVTDQKEGVLMVSASAITLNKKGESVLTVLKDGKPTQISVKVGLENDTDSEIISSEIKEGDEYVIPESN